LVGALAARKVQGEPAYVIARKAQIAPSTLSQIARGWVTPSAETASRIAFALGLGVAEVFPDEIDREP
jgi:transcriptional regulator with XRE-family HTH domain